MSGSDADRANVVRGGLYRQRKARLPVLFYLKERLPRFTSISFAMKILDVVSPTQNDMNRANLTISKLRKDGLVVCVGKEPGDGDAQLLVYEVDWEAVRAWMEVPARLPVEQLLWELMGEG